MISEQLLLYIFLTKSLHIYEIDLIILSLKELELLQFLTFISPLRGNRILLEKNRGLYY